jgi:hypothetical protein
VKSFILKRWVLGAIAGVTLGANVAVGQGPSPIFTRNAALRLPVQLDERARAEVAEVKLYVRGPAGRWECVQSAPATQAAFDFKAPIDGEYKFTFVTVDKRGQASPPSVEVAPPHRVVVVDATPPDVTAMPIPFRGEKALQCQVRDANPDWTTLRVGYLTPENTWQPLAVAAADTPTVFKVPTTAVLDSKVRVTVADRAGNRTTREIDLGDPTVPLSLPKPPIENGKPDPALFPKDIAADSIVPPPAPGKSDRTMLPDLPKAPSPAFPDLPPLPDIPTGKPADVKPDLKLPDVPALPSPMAPAPLRAPDVRIPVKTADELMKIPDVPSALPPVASPASALKPIDPPAPPAAPDIPKPNQDTTPAEPGSHPVLNSRTCVINYEVEKPARLGSRIDFWATPDGGRTWVKLQDAAAGNPPAKLTLPGDGVFGIRIRPNGGAKPPEPGEDPDCVIEIDTTKPSVMLSSPTVGAEDGVMLINWEASDKQLLNNAINLYYAGKPEGPWEVIVHGYKNTGAYRWTMPAGLAGPVYLRMEASDKAGNVGRHDLPIPVSLDTGKQRVKVIGVGAGK